ncbi:MAG: Gfo/Idh/MocA family oxidoreductase, partial [Bacteroidales bacterium]|nr:Gfo/Idh/MocA family oxidoreductase [Bacteroidales bacterium]
MKKIKIAVIGAGYIADYHARGLQALSNVEIAMVVDTQAEAAQKFASKYSIKEVGNDAMNLLQRDDIDAVVLG